MTTLAYRDGILAADRRMMCAGWKVPYEATKIFSLNSPKGIIAGVTGEYAEAVALIEWLRKPAQSSEMPKISENSRVVVVTARDVLEIYEASGVFTVRAKYAAWGSGMPPATAALIMGASAVRAVEVAAMVDEGTGPDVEMISIHGECNARQ